LWKTARGPKSPAFTPGLKLVISRPLFACLPALWAGVKRILTAGFLSVSPLEKELQTLALESAARLLKYTAAALPLHVPQPIFKKTITLNIGGVKRKCVLHILMPGVIRLYDLDTNELLAESATGQFDQLAPGFITPGKR
jgi:hypothetical protein